jgi:hypothetical protein
MPLRSPGAASEMSGTTAISSFSMVEADLMDPKYIMKHLRKLCDASQEFLEHIAPDDGTIVDDQQNIREIQKPDSDFSEDYRDFNDELNVHLKHYKTEGNNYIHVRAINRALFGPSHDVSAAQSGLDLILYLTNLLVFGKQMIPSHRNEKEMWTILRHLDNVFPSPFMLSLISNGTPTNAGESALLDETFQLALDLRTQLAILVLERSSSESDFDPDTELSDVFLRSDASQDAGASIVRGWGMAPLGADDVPLHRKWDREVIERVTKMKERFPLDDESLARGEVIDLEGLSSDFPWEAVVLRILHWVRLRHRELRTTIEELGGATAILENVKQQILEPRPANEFPRATSVPRESPRRKRASFGRDRRRSRKFDPNAPVDLLAIDALKARERLSEATTARQSQEEQRDEATVEELEEEQHIPTVEEIEDEQHIPTVEVVQHDYQPIIDEEEEELPLEQPEVVEQESEAEDEPEPEPEPAGSSRNPTALLKALKEVSKPEKENRATSIFDRQGNAQRVEFGDGFDTQPTPGPSTRDKGKQRAQPSPNKKRSRPVEAEDDSEDDAFETAQDGTMRAQARRQHAPVTKKVRIDPTSSAAPPTSHQPPPRRHVANAHRHEPTQEESVSETDAPDMMEDAPPRSQYHVQRDLARQAIAPERRPKERKVKTAWTEDEEAALVNYMEDFPAKYSAILAYDKTHGDVLRERDQVALKDKARYMARDMIK